MKPNIAFVIGCQRSGTTLLSDTLGKHPDIATWNEPYFIWDRHLPQKDTDVRTAAEATERVKKFTDAEFSLFQKKQGCRLVIEKSPENCFRLPFVHALYPQAKFINIIRDGRDVTLSIVREWNTRAAQVTNRDFRRWARLMHQAWREQPFLRNRLQQAAFEIKNTASFNPEKFLNKARWQGYPGWGPRFPGWQEEIGRLSQVEFNALQWVKATEQVEKDRAEIPPAQIINVRYEDILKNPQAEIGRALGFLGMSAAALPEMIADIRPDNAGKWRKVFALDEQKKIETIQKPLLEKLGYETELSHAA